MRRRGDRIKLVYFFLLTGDEIFLIFGGKCRLVERKPARCAENKKRGGENVAIFNVIVEFPLYRRMWSGAIGGLASLT